ncbi:MAG: TetR family transcriptional regulator C-terminal domain-containing protein [Deltaproteobacteria bacterium]|nr:TetR family transcriptional regulator C-terminal domain-containing protein [Deltaproteobacteria bacterium]
MGRKKMGDRRRRQILAGLLEAMQQRGLQRCNMSDVARAAGVSRGILHYYFKNKDEMIGALVAHLKERYYPDFRERTTQIDDPEAQLRESLWYPVQTFGQDGAALAKVWIEFWGLAAHHAEVHAFILELQQLLRAHFSRIIQAGVESGVFHRERQPERCASIILAALEGLILQWHFNPEGLSFVDELKVLERMLERYLAAGA